MTHPSSHPPHRLSQLTLALWVLSTSGCANLNGNAPLHEPLADWIKQAFANVGDVLRGRHATDAATTAQAHVRVAKAERASAPLALHLDMADLGRETLSPTPVAFTLPVPEVKVAAAVPLHLEMDAAAVQAPNPAPQPVAAAAAPVPSGAPAAATPALFAQQMAAWQGQVHSLEQRQLAGAAVVAAATPAKPQYVLKHYKQRGVWRSYWARVDPPLAAQVTTVSSAPLWVSSTPPAPAASAWMPQPLHPAWATPVPEQAVRSVLYTPQPTVFEGAPALEPGVAAMALAQASRTPATTYVAMVAAVAKPVAVQAPISAAPATAPVAPAAKAVAVVAAVAKPRVLTPEEFPLPTEPTGAGPLPVASAPAASALAPAPAPAPAPALPPTPAPVQPAAVQTATAPSSAPAVVPPVPSSAPAPAPLPAPVVLAAAPAPKPLTPQAPAAPQPRDDLASVVPASRAERRFSVVLTNATPEVLFMALLAESPISVAVDPAVKGPMSVSLKDMTLREALELIRELHSLEYKVIGRHILVSPAQMQTRIFTVDYPSFNRQGRSDTRVVSGSITGAGGGSSGGSSPSSGSSGNSSSGGGSSGGGGGPESSRITTSQRNDVWGEIESTIKLLVGDKDGRSVIVSPQTGNIVVRAMPRELRSVQDYLTSTRASIERQVMLEAKVVEVQLSDKERTGINWAAFRSGSSNGVVGAVAPGVNASSSGNLVGQLITATPGSSLIGQATNLGSVLGLAFQTTNFATVLEFLGTQGNSQVLSSPRIATMNNQKALLKVGTDDFFVTNISTTSTSSGNSTQTSPSIGVQPFFSGISLDVTPSITADGMITLHIHPAVSTVSERAKVLNLGTMGSYTLPLASSDINETDAVVRARDGQIIAIGGLMRQASVNSDSGMPGAEGSIWRKLLGGQTSKMTEKRELVILLKPTIVDPNSSDADGRTDMLQRLLDWTEGKGPKPN